MSHTLQLASALAVASREPVASTSIARTGPLWPLQLRTWDSELTSQQSCCRLLEALYSLLPDGLNARAVTGSVSPWSVERSSPDAASTSCKTRTEVWAARHYTQSTGYFGHLKHANDETFLR